MVDGIDSPESRFESTRMVACPQLGVARMTLSKLWTFPFVQAYRLDSSTPSAGPAEREHFRKRQPGSDDFPSWFRTILAPVAAVGNLAQEAFRQESVAC